jgi:hypothetical protein
MNSAKMGNLKAGPILKTLCSYVQLNKTSKRQGKLWVKEMLVAMSSVWALL